MSPWAIRDARPHRVDPAPINAYPWWADQTWGTDPYGEIKRQCVSYAAWYINAHGTPFGLNTRGPRGLGTFGNATDWDAAAFRAGFTVSTRPVVGSIAQWHAWEQSSWVAAGRWYTFQAGGLGHVGVVVATYWDGTVDVAQYNLGESRSFSVVRMRAPRYIYVPLA